MIHAVAIFRTKPELRDQALEAFRALSRDVLNESGCLEYALTVDAQGLRPSKGTLGEDAIAIVEKWESLPAFQAHMQAAHMLEFSATAKDYFVGRIVHVLQTESNR